MSELSTLRTQIDRFMQQHPQSPLSAEQRRGFDGLTYYEPDSTYILSGAIERFPTEDPLIEMQTSIGSTQQYRRWGKFTFHVNGDAASVVIYTDPHGHDLFMPFKDLTNGAETYGAGRYLDSHRPGLTYLGDDQIEIDFNYAYNPYCAYNEHYSCPLPPPENWLSVPIKAGERKFKD